MEKWIFERGIMTHHQRLPSVSSWPSRIQYVRYPIQMKKWVFEWGIMTRDQRLKSLLYLISIQAVFQAWW
jgi:hypothetical protein